MNKKIFLFRHGQTEHNRLGIIQGQSHNPLNDTGIAQAQALGKELQEKRLDCLISSDLKRTVQTAEIVSTYCSIPFETSSELREICAGTAQGTLRAHFIAQTSFWADWCNEDRTYDFIGYPDGETKGQARARVVDWMHNFIESTNYQRIGICSHGRVLRLLVNSLIDQIIYFENGDYLELEYDPKSQQWQCCSAVTDEGMILKK